MGSQSTKNFGSLCWVLQNPIELDTGHWILLELNGEGNITGTLVFSSKRISALGIFLSEKE